MIKIMKKKAYMAPATVIITTSLRHIICGSQKVTLAEQSVITKADDTEEVPEEADARINKWDDEDEYDE
jgi:hypothetical protein